MKKSILSKIFVSSYGPFAALFTPVLTTSAFIAGLLAPVAVFAGFANTAHFVQPDHFSIGIEPELTLSNGAGVGGTLRYTHGLNDLSNASLLLGTGTGVRKFRVGSQLTFDFFPDTANQPGIGLALQAVYYRMGFHGAAGAPATENEPTFGRLELTPMPYVHKNFGSPGGEFEPYLSFPFGWAFTEGQYQSISQLVLGSMFKAGEHFRYSLELGVAVNHTESYFSTGVMYYY